MSQPRPALAPAPHWAFPEPERHHLDNGVTVLFYERPGQYVVSAGLVMPVPLSVEPRGSEGVAALTAATLDQGTSTWPGTAFADAVEAGGAVIDAGVGYAHAEVSMDVPGSRVADVARLFADAVRNPELTDDEVDQQRQIRQAHLQQQLARSADRAHQGLRHALIAPGFREQRLPGGETATLGAVTGASVRDHHRRWFSPTDATLVVAGDLPRDGLDALMAAFADWSQPEVGLPLSQPPTPQPSSAVIIDRPGSVQADIRWGWFTIDRTDPRWASLQLGTHAIGGGFGSRLNTVLREDLGYTYGVHLSNAPMRQGGMSYVSGSFRTEVVGRTLALLPSLISVADRPLTDAETNRARDYLVGVTPLRYATAGGLCDGVISALVAGLEPSYPDEQLSAWREVTAADATEAAAQLIRPDAGTLVVVGDADALEPEVRAAGWEPSVTR
ncbi:MAG: M16 family metallopeptidase [Propioniciclava sp.]